ncbi:lipoprotein LipL45 [Leptospira sp. 2 VSF19]|uniref:Lipoprotein LipL45 n=1 Tax=Leptospira soteropolitanensis TaxID=2950025 RepID=A0AAW5V9Z6_9LEPT|nr:lipoprotein LipL45 [Leptospira soteropolitanensis]MCW7492797.1 lipoprotein LipL45 [Leptospira soteropolitanensis]MCW7500032.1 lipoprotein LipL45 [Leptospira soteropolitanensis]MCW7522283.1 lipoprotein LipL45 [Leptospira soteropolitanensis]MCW7526139.1 lipoprotein LipL45 [Leptospira soteropolitanensis]MCW7529749.1 lipoprotein LipL45 [Leptospira soteropolitanensis]
MKASKLTIMGLALLFTGLTVCKKPDAEVSEAPKKAADLSAVVVFAVGDSKIQHADQTEEKAQLGALLKSGDNVVTGDNGKVDIQFADGSSIRISPKSAIDFAKLSQDNSGTTDTQIALVSGKVFAKVNKAKKEDNFTVVTPTAIAGVRGTSFIVEAAEGKPAKVKVVEGAVAFAPRVPALEKLSSEEISGNADLKKLQESIAKAEVILEKDQASTQSAKSADLAKSADIQTLDLNKAFKTAEKEKLVVESAKLTKNEEQEIKTIVTVDKQTAQEIAKLSETAQTEKLDELKKQEIDAKRQAIESEVAKRQEEEKKKFEESLANQPKEFKSKKDIVNYYERIEKIVLVDGKTVIGAIINQENGQLIVHTENGVKRIDMDNVEEVIYDLQQKSKF